MKSRVLEKERVIALRRKGYTYREILKEVPVSKSSISLWLKDSPLTAKEKDILKSRKNADITRWKLRAAASLRSARESRDKELFAVSKEEFLKWRKDSFYQVGIALYWAEGSKRNTTFSFINSDPEMIKLMIRWIKSYLLVRGDKIKLRVFTHKAFEHENHELFWSKETGIDLSDFGKIIFKSQGLAVKKRPNYKGCLRIELGKVQYLRKLLFWQQMLIEYYQKQR